MCKIIMYPKLPLSSGGAWKTVREGFQWHTYVFHGLEFVDVRSLSVDQFLDVLLSLDLIRLQTLHNLHHTMNVEVLFSFSVFSLFTKCELFIFMCMYSLCIRHSSC